MSDHPIRDALNKPISFPDLPDNTVVIAGEHGKDGTGVSVQAEIDPGKPGGAFFGASAQWWKDQGYKALIWFGFK